MTDAIDVLISWLRKCIADNKRHGGSDDDFDKGFEQALKDCLRKAEELSS